MSEALRLADLIERYNSGVHSQSIIEDYTKASAELRRLHAEVDALRAEADALRLNAASVQPELVAVALAACDAVDDLIEKWYATRESGCLPNQVVRARGASKLLRAIALEKENSND